MTKASTAMIQAGAPAKNAATAHRRVLAVLTYLRAA